MGNSSCSCFLAAAEKAETRPNEGKSEYWFKRSKSMERYARFLRRAAQGINKADPPDENAGQPDDKKVLLGSASTDSKRFAAGADHSLRHSMSSTLLRSFNYAELRVATRNFRPDTLLGEGGFGSVFKGWVGDGGQGTGSSRIVIAVKKLNLEGLQGHKEWLAEVNYLGQLHHPNLVRLIGFCAEDDHRLLVYEFMPRGSLENHLFRRNGHGQALSWAIRMKVAVGAARGLTFLHEAKKPVIFRDFKASNILLDSKFNPKLSDFGLAKDGPTGDNTHVSTRVMGTYGYAAPEYVATGHLTAKSDVYSFGVVLLELLTGRRAVDKCKPFKEQNLVDWAWPYLIDRRKLLQIMDPRLQGLYSMKGAHRAANLALSCLNPDAKLRPAMKEVVQHLEPLVHLRESAKYSCNLTVQGHVHRLHQTDPYKRMQNGPIWHEGVYAAKHKNLLVKHHEKGVAPSFRHDLPPVMVDRCNSLPAFHSTRTKATS